MSDGLYVLHDSDLPSLGEWQAALDSMGLKLVLDRRVSPAGHAGYFPARLGRKQSGFELHQEDGSDILANGGTPTERPWKHATLLIWHDETELLAAYMAGAALARATDGVVHDPLDAKTYTLDQTLAKIRDIRSWARQPRPICLKSKIKGVLDSSPDVIFRDNALIFQPIGYYLRGCAIGVMSGTTIGTVYKFVNPLFEGVSYGGWGTSLLTAQGVYGWDVGSPRFSEEFMTLFESKIRPAVADVTNGAAFLKYLETEKVDGDWHERGRAAAYLHMGNLAAAKPGFTEFLDRMDEWHSEIKDLLPGRKQGPVVETARQVCHLIEHDPGMLGNYLHEVAATQIRLLKLQKDWVAPKSFF